MDRVLQAIIPGSHLIDVIPALEYIPYALSPWKRKGRRWYEIDTVFFMGLVKDVEDKLVRTPPFRTY